MTSFMTKLVLFGLLSTLAFAGDIHDRCNSTDFDSKNFAIAYAGGVMDVMRDDTLHGKALYKFPPDISYEMAFYDICGVIDQHPELWNKPSRDAITFAVVTLWKKKN